MHAEALDMLDAMAGMAEAMRLFAPAPAAMWELRASEPGHPRERRIPLASLRDCRALALDLSEGGLHVAIHDPAGRLCLEIWPRGD